MELVKRKRGRPRKNPLPEEINNLVLDTLSKLEAIQESLEKKEIIKEEPIIRTLSSRKWDVPLSEEIEFFDANLSYELTGYIPINETSGLDFDPSWFTEARDTFNRTGRYCSYLYGSKAFNDFWREQYKRCKYGMTVNGYTVTGDHYYFLNFYQLKDLDSTQEAGSGRTTIFPDFMEGQYEWFHYLLMAKRLKMNACMMKAREAGYSEIEASIISKSYTVIKGSVNVCCAFAEVQLNKLWEKIESNLSFLDLNTDGGFSHGRLVDSANLKRSGLFEMRNGTKVPSGWQSQIQKIVVDKPGKLRGDRTDILMFEEVGLWPKFTKAYTQADALVGQIGHLFGLRLLGGTGGEAGAAVEGLRKVYYNPKLFGVLPFRHNYTLTGEEAITAFFLPAFKTIKDRNYRDHRGFTEEKLGRSFFDRVRAIKQSDPNEYVTYCAEFCYNGEEAFSLEGDNKFNKINIAELLTNIRALKKCPPIDTGYIEYLYKNSKHIPANIIGFKWIDNKTSKLKILEHPLWTLPPKLDERGLVEWAPPPDPIRNLYVIGVDGIDIGKSQTSDATKDPSDYCAVVFKRAYGTEPPKFVAIYKDRPNDPREAYKITVKLALYYNAVVNVEATRTGVISYARDNNLLKWFMRRPKATLAVSSKNTSKQYGTPATVAIIDHQTDLIADYVNDYCHEIWFDEMLDELNRYTDENKRKFDIVASMGMAMLANEELSGTPPKMVESEDNRWLDFGYYYDEYGRRRYGVLPLKPNITGNIDTIEYENYGTRTSNPRLFEILNSPRVY